MSTPSTSDLAAHLVAHAGANPDSAALLAGMLLDQLRFPAEGGAPSVVDRDGRTALDASGIPKTAESLIGDLRREIPQLFTSAKPSAPVAAARSGVTGMTAKAAAEHAAAQARQASGEPANPYASATRNLTLQVMMEKNNPEIAARFKAEAAAT